MLAFLDRLSRVKEDNKRPFALEQHIVILGLNEVGFEVGEVYRHRGRDVLCITLDPQLHHVLTQCFEPGLARRDLEAAQEAARKATLGVVMHVRVCIVRMSQRMFGGQGAGFRNQGDGE